MILYFLLGVYLGGGLVFAILAMISEEALDKEEKSLYRVMIFIWPFYSIMIILSKIIGLIKKGNANG